MPRLLDLFKGCAVRICWLDGSHSSGTVHEVSEDGRWLELVGKNGPTSVINTESIRWIKFEAEQRDSCAT